MKSFLVTFALILCALTVQAQTVAQTVTLKGKSQPQVQLNWTLPVVGAQNPNWGGCTTASPCTFRPSSIPGTCPATLVGSTGWTQLADTSASATAATDTAPAPNSAGQVSYVVSTVQGTLISDPSNCVTVIVPLAPSPATGLAGK